EAWTCAPRARGARTRQGRESRDRRARGRPGAATGCLIRPQSRMIVCGNGGRKRDRSVLGRPEIGIGLVGGARGLPDRVSVAAQSRGEATLGIDPLDPPHFTQHSAALGLLGGQKQPWHGILAWRRLALAQLADDLAAVFRLPGGTGEV